MLQIKNEQLKAARRSIESILTTIPGVTLDWNTYFRNEQPVLTNFADFTVTVKTEHRADTLVVEFKPQGHPRQLREAIDRLLRIRHRSNRADYLVVAAPFITSEGAKVCEEENVGYYDLAGNCRLVFGNYFVERNGRPNPFRKDHVGASNLYGPKSERVLRVLFDGQEWKVVPLAKRARVSTGTVSIVRNLLLEREWAREGSGGLTLTEPQKLLTDWAAVWKRRRETPKTYFTLAPLAEIETAMAKFADQHHAQFALTGAAGAWRVAPMTRYNRTQVYWEGDPEQLAAGVGLKPADTGANVHVFAPRDDGVFFGQQIVEGAPIVSALQLYLDLQRDPARGEEAAEHIWNVSLFPPHAG
ncbi:MAG TPA: type IV toxin-antitoxin system AbiEi family antitoxin [Opitutaceae bacterium]|nr:type IV toxin-antitoxin system AbiEi family antitoxin [Opitutaceae bacterium]